MRRWTSRGATMGALFLSFAGCQLVTGTFDVDGKPDSGSGSLGTNCTDVAACCTVLTGSLATQCKADVELKSEQVCAAFLQNAMCSITTHRDGGSPQTDGSMPQTDGSMPQMDSMGSGQDVFEAKDVSTGKDASVAKDVSTGKDVFVGHDSSHDSPTTDPLDGTWNLTGAQCQAGETLSIVGTVTLTFSGKNVEEVDTLTDGCVVTENLDPATVTSSDITATAGSISCGVSCTSSDCTAGTTGASDMPYTLSGSTLTITLPDSTGTCVSGFIEYFWTK
jgi:hypothetical protein